MNNLYIGETKYTPLIDFDAKKGILILKGKSYPENAYTFYKPLFNWIDEYFNGKSKFKTVINFNIIYFNSSSSKVFFDMFDLLEEVHTNGANIEINWFYDKENDNALEAGMDFKDEFLDLNFNLINNN